MRKLTTFLLLFFSVNVFLFANEFKKNCVLTGVVHNFKAPQITINKQSIDLNSKGQFYYRLSLEKPAYFKINYGKHVPFYLHPGDSIHLEIDANKELNSIKVIGDRNDINQYLIQDAYETEKLTSYLKKNYRHLFRLIEKKYIEKIDGFKRPFEDRLEKFIDESQITDDYFIKTQRAIIQYSYADNLFNYPNWHRRFSDETNYQPSECFYDFLDKVDLNDSELLDILEYSNFLDSYLRIKSEQELKESRQYENLNYKPFRAKMQVTLNTFTNPTVRSEMLYSFMKQFTKEYYHKGIEDLIELFKQNCVNQVYLREIEEMIENDKSVREKCKIQVYKQVGEIALNAFVYFPGDLKQGEKRSALAFFHGGGWECGKPEWGHEQCSHFSSLGMVCISFEYRLKTQHDVTPLESMADAKSAIRWMRQHAQELAIDPQQIVASGFSAGGHLATCTVMIDKFDEPDEDQSISSAANALMLWVTPVKILADGWFRQILKERAEVSKCDPDQHIRPGLPPMIIFQGTEDDQVPFWSVKEFARKVKALGNRCELNIYDGQTHLGWGENEKDVFQKMDQFLESLGYLDFKEEK